MSDDEDEIVDHERDEEIVVAVESDFTKDLSKFDDIFLA